MVGARGALPVAALPKRCFVLEFPVSKWFPGSKGDQLFCMAVTPFSRSFEIGMLLGSLLEVVQTK